VLAHGKLLALDSQVDSSTGTVRAKARFDNGAGTLFPQQFVNVRVLVDTLHNSVIAPNTAVLRGADGLYVYVVQGGQDHHTVTIKNVKTGDSDGTNTAIISGVDPGETVVTDGSDRLREGAPVLLPGDCVPAFGGGGRHGRHGGGQGGQGQAGQGQAGQGGAKDANGCPKGEVRLSPAAAKAGADSASAASGAAGGPGSANAGGSSSDDAGAQQSLPAGRGQGGEGPGQNQGGRTQAMLSQLDLDPQQQLKAQAIFAQARAQAMNGAASSGENPDAMRQARRQAYDKAFDQLNAILRPDQKAKLSQLRAQMQQERAQRGGGDQGGGQ
jgi:membrane fusion protein, multidrug efflux system